MNVVGNILNKPAMRAVIITRNTTQSLALPIRKAIHFTYPLVIQFMNWLNLIKKLPIVESLFSLGVCGFNKVAQSAGVSVKATKADNAIEIAIVKAN